MEKKTCKLLIVDDEIHICASLRRVIEREGFETLEAHNGRDALKMIRFYMPDALLLDIRMPEMDGMEVLKKTRELDPDLPVIMITARGGIEDKAIAFRHGADDYLVKPFDPHELIMRIQAVLKRASEAGSAVKNPLLYRQAITIGRPDTVQLMLDPDSQAVFLDQQPVAVPRREFQLLSLLAENQNQTLTRGQIVEHLWGLDFEGDLRVVDLYIDRLRKKLAVPAPKAADWSIRTVRGLGYRLEVRH